MIPQELLQIANTRITGFKWQNVWVSLVDQSSFDPVGGAHLAENPAHLFRIDSHSRDAQMHREARDERDAVIRGVHDGRNKSQTTPKQNSKQLINNVV